MRSARWRAAVIACAAYLSLVACGISSGPVISEGKPTNPAGSNDVSGPLENLARPEVVSTPVELVNRFLRAAADDPARRDLTLKSYLKPGAGDWTPPKDVNVVRVVEGPTSLGMGPSNVTTVTVKVQHIGALTAEGRVLPNGKGEKTMDFEVVREGVEGYYLRSAPSELLLTDASLASNFDIRPLFFWDNTKTQLVPDLRYVSKRLTETLKANLLLTWLYQGPSAWLSPAVTPLPAATAPGPGSRVVIDDDKRLVVDLAADPGDEQPRLTAQLRETLLYSGPATGLQLKVKGEQLEPVLAAPPNPVSGPRSRRYAVVNGVVQRLSNPSGRGEVAVDLGDYNKNVIAAAFAHREAAAALVHPDGNRVKLTVVRNRVGVEVVFPGGKPATIGQPVWLNQADNVLLVLADGKLYQVADGKAVAVPGISGASAMSVAADGTRIAFVADSKLWIAALIRSDSAVYVGAPQSVPTMFTQVQNVAFGVQREQRLVVAGTTGERVRLLTMNLDGVDQTLFGDDNPPRNTWVSYLAADPQSGNAIYEVHGFDSFQAQQFGPETLRNSLLQPAPGSAVPTPTPDLSKAIVTAPSFEG